MYQQLHPVTYYFYPLFDTQSAAGTPPAAVQERLQAPPAAGVETLLYVHIPYCHDLCRFCPFHVRVDKGEEVYARYTDALVRELELLAATPRARASDIRAVYFGGGSPSIFAPELLRRIFSTLRSRFALRPDTEISFEGEPKTLGDGARLDELKDFGVSRVSFGLQTYDAALRTHFNINATLDDVERARRMCREWGFDEINVDMMYNLPGQTIPQLERDIRSLAADGFDSVDYYNLHYYAFSKKFLDQMASGEIPPKPSDGVMLSLAEHVRHLLPRLGYANVADQVYSKRPAVCEYFRLLWGGGAGRHDAETLAAGASARGYVDGYCYMNEGSATRYIEAVNEGRLPIDKVSGRLERPENRGAVFFSKFLALDKRWVEARESIPAQTFQSWIDAGYLYDGGDRWLLSERGKLWTNNITHDAFEPSQLQTAKGSLIKLASKPGVRTGTF
ncbi:radical SAM protein [Aquabacterium sp. A7-Y]|uniref:coproporphyrinogen-III oxidase family protein n=1 Tax=Aquabacterium sp. A7-Y TaxID=1349605 RepID=UPI00223CB40C|nr:radical SAM protein [Aquabacterium sp. A7-Y]MCW7536899.1 radical SAM protein [Aquabacterium sp. A7-Y]